MAGMLQILTYLLSFYLVVKGIEVLQIGITSARPNRSGPVVFGVLTLLGCIIAAASFTSMQDQQAISLNRSMPSFPSAR